MAQKPDRSQGHPQVFDDLSEVTMKISLPRQRKRGSRAIPTLRVVAGPDMLHFLSLGPGGQFTIGRDDSSSLILSDPSVSRHHVQLFCDDQGEVTLLDLGSTNGTTVNGHLAHRAMLRPGDHLEIGEVSLRLDLFGLDELAHLARVVETLRQAGRDPLTRLHTRAFLGDELALLMNRCADAELPLSLVFADIDRFKGINDHYGHAVGDAVLQGIARLMMVGVRDSDPVVRYGGEEIAVWLPGTDEEAALEVAERLRRTISGHDWGRTAQGLKVTASFGVTQRRSGAEPLSEWFERADQALLRAKREGRNRVLRGT